MSLWVLFRLISIFSFDKERDTLDSRSSPPSWKFHSDSSALISRWLSARQTAAKLDQRTTLAPLICALVTSSRRSLTSRRMKIFSRICQPRAFQCELAIESFAANKCPNRRLIFLFLVTSRLSSSLDSAAKNSPLTESSRDDSFLIFQPNFSALATALLPAIEEVRSTPRNSYFSFCSWSSHGARRCSLRH